MDKIKLFKHYKLDALEQNVNDWLEQTPKITVESIEYQISDYNGIEYSICVHYYTL